MPLYLYFWGAVIVLLLGYFCYSRIIVRIFGAEPSRATPVRTHADGVDYVEMPASKVFLIQFLNIAGLGPVFGPILGVLYGPAALFWIAFGCVFGGAVHDYLTGMLSVRHEGHSMPEVAEIIHGRFLKLFLQIFCMVMLILVGVVFVAGPAGLLSHLTGFSAISWSFVIFAYYIVATIYPVDKIIGRFYPYFAAILIIMTISLLVALLFSSEVSLFSPAFFADANPQGLPAWPMVFITIACGAVSGFHSTQSPLMARCLDNEKRGREIFYGAMIAEGFIALIWATLAMSWYDCPKALWDAMGGVGNTALAVNDISIGLLGKFGGALAILGVVVLPITSGDTAFRSSRLLVSEYFNLEQVSKISRLKIALPLFAVGIALNFMDFSVLWRYFGFSNQFLAALGLWIGAIYLKNNHKFHWVASLPACFMTAVCVSYICFEPNIGLHMAISSANVVAAVVTLAIFAMFMLKKPEAGDESAPVSE
ncbi:MAG: carbon starvation protein A [bacterium]|nr:carbon starvation protein A [bacterium]